MRSKHNPLPLAPTNQLKEASLTFLECTQLKPDPPFTATTQTSLGAVDSATLYASEEAEQTTPSDTEAPQEDENEEVFYPKNYSYYFEDSDGDSEFEYVPVDSEDDLNSVGSASDEEQEEESQELFVTHKPPFWYANEDPQHIEEILKKYSETLIKPSDYKNRSHQPFVARVQRHNITTGDLFQTYDIVLICNNQRLPDPTCPLPVIEEIHLLTFWDEDGIPIKFCTLGQQQIGFWQQKLEEIIPSYLRCVPDYFGQNPLDISLSKFVFSTSDEYDDIYYSNLPWNHTPFNAFVKPRKDPSDDEPECPSANPNRFYC